MIGSRNNQPRQAGASAARLLRPPRERGTGKAFALAAVMHLLLIWLLYHGINWQNNTPAGAEAEIWTEIPDTPAPPPPPTPQVKAQPAPPARDEEAEIALLQEKKRKQQEAEARRQQQLAAQAAAAAQQKAMQEKQKQIEQQRQADLQKQQQQQKAQQEKTRQQAEAKAEADAKAKAAAEVKAKLDTERKQRLAALQGQLGSGKGAGGTATSPGYAEKVQRRVRPNIVWAGETAGLETVVSVRCSPSGTLLSASITRSSGNEQWDQAALRAVQRSDPMPTDIDGKAPDHFTITLRPAGG